MIPKSDELELFLERVIALDKKLAAYNGAQVQLPQFVADIKTVARDWLRFSEAIRESVGADAVSVIDAEFKAILQAANARTRSSAYRKRLKPVIESFTEKIVIPVIRHEGSPSQVASRTVLSAITANLTNEEAQYVEEAARCLAAKCNRAAIIMLWAAAIARMHRAVENVGFIAFNQAVDDASKKKGSPFNKVVKITISSLPELQRCRDFDLLVVGMQLFGYDLQVYGELDRLLGTRNSAAHPGMLQPSVLDVQQYASKLNVCVFAQVSA
jgi:hypothetical protein